MGSEIRWVVGGGLIGEQQRAEDAAAQAPVEKTTKGKAKPVAAQAPVTEQDPTTGDGSTGEEDPDAVKAD